LRVVDGAKAIKHQRAKVRSIGHEALVEHYARAVRRQAAPGCCAALPDRYIALGGDATS